MAEIREECGVVAVYNDPEVLSSTILALHTLQHRGQDSSGIGVAGNGGLKVEKYQGYVISNFIQKEVSMRLRGTSSIGHVRYATVKGGDLLKCAHPVEGVFKGAKFLLAHNGHIANYKELEKELKNKSKEEQTDTDIIVSLIEESKADSIAVAFKEVIQKCIGGFATVVLEEEGTIMATRDSVGIRPLHVGFDDERIVLASETCSFSVLDINDFREVKPGEIMVINSNGVKSEILPYSNKIARLCIFEIIYLSRPDSRYLGKSVYEHRKEIGRYLAKSYPIDADIVLSVPSSGDPAARGYARELNIPMEDGLLRSHYVWRTFIEPSQEIREKSVLLKHSVNRDLVKDQNVVLVDDSIVRGTTMKRIVKLLKIAGTREVHVRIGCPQIMYPDFFGIEISNTDLLISAHNNEEEVREFIGADSLEFLSIGNLYKAIGFNKRDDGRPQMADHYFTGEYPVNLDGLT